MLARVSKIVGRLSLDISCVSLASIGKSFNTIEFASVALLPAGLGAALTPALRAALQAHLAR